jgi:hypothetical protein
MIFSRLLFITLLCSSGAWASLVDADTDFQRALSLVNNGKDAEAIGLYRQLIKGNPSEPVLYNNLAALLAKQGNLDGARALLEQGIKAHPVYQVLYQNLTQVVVTQARQNYTKALRIKDKIGGKEELVSLGEKLFLFPAVAAKAEFKQQPQADRKPVPVGLKPVLVKSSDTDSLALAPSAQPAKGSATENSEQVRAFIIGWSHAWESQNIDNYLTAYRSGYTPKGYRSHENWVSERRRRILGKNKIEIDLSDIRITSIGNSGYQVDFVMAYRSDNYRDRSEKRLILETVKSQIRIRSEQTLRVLK